MSTLAPSDQPDSANAESTPDKTLLQRRLENKLLTRLTKAELIDKHIIVSEAAASLHTSATALDRQRRSDMLAGKLKNRPSPESLYQANIIKAPLNVAPSLHEAQQSLLKQRTEDLLNQHLQNRPLPRALVAQNIIPPASLQPSLSLESFPVRPRRKEFTRTPSALAVAQPLVADDIDDEDEEEEEGEEKGEQ